MENKAKDLGDLFITHGYIVEKINGNYELTPKFYALMGKPVPKSMKIQELAEKFKELWPKGVKTNNGDYVRSGIGALKIKLQTFKNKNSHIPDQVILDATQAYVERFALKNYDYIMIAGNFISKGQDSKLEAECEAYMDGEVEDEGSLFTGKVV